MDNLSGVPMTTFYICRAGLTQPKISQLLKGWFRGFWGDATKYGLIVAKFQPRNRPLRGLELRDLMRDRQVKSIAGVDSRNS